MNSDMSIRTIAVLVVEQELGQRLGQLGLADAGGPEEQERAHGTVLVLQARARAAHGVETGLHRLFLPDHALANPSSIGEASRARLPASCPPARRSSATHLRDLLGAHGLSTMTALVRLGLGQLLFQLRDHAVGQLRRLGQIALALGLIQFGARGPASP
jgi:hypothetical protein